jgi:hypothetical protein
MTDDCRTPEHVDDDYQTLNQVNWQLETIFKCWIHLDLKLIEQESIIKQTIDKRWITWIDNNCTIIKTNATPIKRII